MVLPVLTVRAAESFGGLISSVECRILLPLAGGISTSAGSSFEAHRRFSLTVIRDRIGFLVHHHEVINHFGAVWQKLGKDRFDIVVVGDDGETLRETSNLAKPHGYRIVEGAKLLASHKRYRHLVSNHYVGNYGDGFLINALGERNIRFMYALGKAKWTYADWNGAYDAFLCYGPYHAEHLAPFKGVKLQMGYPRYDEFFHNTIDVRAWKKKFNCREDRKTVVWLPTWKELSSVPAFARAIAELSSSFNVIVKPHPLSIPEEPDKIALLQQLPFTNIILSHLDNVYLYAIADFILCDYGGPMFGAIYTDRNLLLLNVEGASADQYTGDDSPDVSIRSVIPNIGSAEASHLERMLRDDGLWQRQIAERHRAREIFFAPYYGFASDVAALLLNNIDSVLSADSMPAGASK